MFSAFWEGLGRAARVGFVAGLAAIVAVTAALAVWLLRTDYDLLFGNLSVQDAAALTAELDRMKLPYELGAEGTSIYVDRRKVHQTRLKLMGKDLPLHGAVGFELFDNSDFGMTEFAQKVNYQRALQGEITRTILSLSEIESARVHVAFPEEGLFKRDKARAKASVTLALRHGQALRGEQVAGIRRLVAAAVPGVASQDVTIVDQHGVALTRPAAEDGQGEPAHRLDLKRDIEQHLARKATGVLERAFGAGQALASVDVTLDMSQVRVTTEDVTAPKAGPGEVATGVMVRERETSRDDGREAAAGSTQREADYQVGRRVEQVVSQPGSIVRLQVLAVLAAPLDAAGLEQAKALLGAAVGASRERGDTILVQAIDAATARSGHDDVVTAPVAPGPASRGATNAPSPSQKAVVAGLLGALLVVAAVFGGWLRRRRESAVGRSPRGLDARQRAAALAQIEAWMEAGRTGGSATEARR